MQWVPVLYSVSYQVHGTGFSGSDHDDHQEEEQDFCLSHVQLTHFLHHHTNRTINQGEVSRDFRGMQMILMDRTSYFPVREKKISSTTLSLGCKCSRKSLTR